jgi:sugar phosphate isomerase/epimerase
MCAGAMAAAAGTRLLGRVGNLEIGVCADSAHFKDAIRYGFDYYEPEVSEIAEMDETRFRAFAAEVLASPVRCKSLYSFVRKLKVVGEDIHHEELQTFVDQALDRCRQLGAEMVVWGSGSSRNVPAGFSRDQAWSQIQDFLRLAGDSARRNHMVIAIEPLQKAHSNIINTAGEALRLVRETNHPNVKMIVDYFHLRRENEDPEILWEARKEIVHLHFANPAGREWPKSPSEDPQYKRFFELVKRIDFRGGMSIEGVGTFENDAAASMRFFHEMLA